MKPYHAEIPDYMRMRVGLSQQIGLSVDEANEFGHDALHRHLATVEFTPANFKIVFKNLRWRISSKNLIFSLI